MSKLKKVRLRDRVVYVVARAAIETAARVPQWLGYRLADWLGRLWFRFDGRRRRYAVRYLRQAYPDLSEKEHLRLGSCATASLFKVPLDLARLTRLLARGGDVREIVDLSQAKPQLDQAKPPFFGLTAHIGNWEVAAAGMARLAGHAHGMARLTKNPLLNKWLLGTRENGGVTMHERRGGFKGLSDGMKNGGIGLQVVDQNQRLRGVFAPFFGKIASCERGAVSMALRRGYPIVVGGALRKGYGFRFELISSPPFYPQNTGDKDKDIYNAVCEVNRLLEELIRRAPEQYLWIHDRYRTQPEDGEVDGKAVG